MTDETTAAPETLTGRAGLENDAGFTPHVDETTPPKEREEFDNAKEAAERLRQLSAPSSTPIARPVLTGLADNVTLTAEEGAKIVAEGRTADREQAQLDSDKALKKEVDAIRPKAEPVAAPVSDEDDVERALKNPRVAAALEARVTEADTARETYTKQVGLANQFAAAAFTEGFPELARLPLDQMADALTAMAHREPARFDKAMATLQRVSQMQQAVAHETQQKTAREAADFQTYSKAEDARFEQLTKGETKQKMEAVTAHIPNMLKELGVDPGEFLKLGNESKFLRSATAQAILYKAAKHDLAEKAGRPKPGAAPIPHVIRPGVQGNRGERAAADLATINNRLSKSGSLKDGFELLKASRKGR
jgi:hypothetical protein